VADTAEQAAARRSLRERADRVSTRVPAPGERAPVRSPRARTGGTPATLPRVSRVTPSPSARAPRTTGRARGRTGRSSGPSPFSGVRSGQRGLRSVSPAAPRLAAEYLACVIIISAQAMTEPGDYASRISAAMWRITAVTVLFFVLALASMSERASKVSVAFGLLVVLGTLYHAGKNMGGTLSQIAGQGRTDDSGQPVDKATLTAELKQPDPGHTIMVPAGGTNGNG
jgi:hypothetical protein